MPGHDHESFHLLQISDSVSDSLPDLDLVSLHPSQQQQHKKKKVRLKRRERNTNRQHHPGHKSAGDHHHDQYPDDGGLLGLLGHGPCCFNSGSHCVPLVVSVSAVMVLLVTVYISSSLNSRIVSLEQQLRMKISDDDSQALPDKVQILESRLESVISNQTGIWGKLANIETSMRHLDEKLQNISDAEKSELGQVKEDLDLLTKISNTNEESIKDIASIVDTLNISKVEKIHEKKKSDLDSSQWIPLNANGKP